MLFQSRDRKLYNPNNAALGMAAMRAGVNHWQAGLIEVGHGMVCKAYAILLVTHGPTHPITKDLEVTMNDYTAETVFAVAIFGLKHCESICGGKTQ